MRLFVSYPSEHRDLVEPVVLALRNGGHKVFFDKNDLPPGQAYDQQIEAAVRLSTAMIFFMAPESFNSGRYQLSELEFARARWPSAHRHVLPVALLPTDLNELPAYLKSVTILEAKGNLATETVRAVSGLRRWDWRWAMMVAGIVTILGLVAIALLLKSHSVATPTELTERTASALIDQLVPEAEKIHVKKIVQAENLRPFLFLIYEVGRDIVFTAIKWRDGQWRIVRTTRDHIEDFLVSSWEVNIDQESRSIAFSGCRPRMCREVWGYHYYQFDLDRSWTLKATRGNAGPVIRAPLGLPDAPFEIYHFERRFYSSLAVQMDPDKVIDAAILTFPRRRPVPPIWSRSYRQPDKISSVETRFLQSLGTPPDTRIDSIFREYFVGDGRARWLVQTVTGRHSIRRLYVVDSRGQQIFEDPRDIDSAWTRLALLPVPGQPPYVAVGGRAGTGAFPFWYVLQAEGAERFARRASSESIETMLNEAFDGVFQKLRR